MSAPNNISVDLAAYNTIDMWNPIIGDAILYNGFFRHWYGIVVGAEQNNIFILKRKLPSMLFLMTEKERIKNTIKISYDEIRNTKSGKYAILQTQRNNTVWYL